MNPAPCVPLSPGTRVVHQRGDMLTTVRTRAPWAACWVWVANGWRLCTSPMFTQWNPGDVP